MNKSQRANRKRRFPGKRTNVATFFKGQASLPVPVRARCISRAAIPIYLSNTAAVVFDYFKANTIYQIDGVNSIANLAGLAYFYSNVLVRRVRVVIRLTNLTATMTVKVAIYPSVSNTAPGSYSLAAEQRLAKTVELGPSGSNSAQKEVQMEVSMAEFFGLTQLSTSDTAYVGAPASAPANSVYICLYHQSADGATATNVSKGVELFYDTEWFGPVRSVA